MRGSPRRLRPLGAGDATAAGAGAAGAWGTGGGAGAGGAAGAASVASGAAAGASTGASAGGTGDSDGDWASGSLGAGPVSGWVTFHVIGGQATDPDRQRRGAAGPSGEV